jgi:hypothetical protein
MSTVYTALITIARGLYFIVKCHHMAPSYCNSHNHSYLVRNQKILLHILLNDYQQQQKRALPFNFLES